MRATAATDLLEENAIGGTADYFGITRIDENGSAFRTDPNTGEELVLYARFGSDCQNGFIWVPTSLTPRSLIPALRARIERTLDDPVPNMSPAPEVGTYMNLGIWLAIEDPGVTSDRLTAGPVWASAQAVLTGFDVDFGNGHVESCEGVGVPIVDTETFAEGPCGYTYEWPDKRGEYDVAITSHYDVTYALSNGESGTLALIDRTTEFPYYVYELVTVGRGN